MNRRKFLQAGAAGLAWSAVGATAEGRAAFAGSKETKRVGLIGSGWYGKVDLLRLIQVAPVEVVSLCDVDARMLAGAAEIVASRQASRKTPRTYSDYRKMLAEKDLDIVLIATPDHWHTLPAIAAIEAGADLYLQKPISVDVAEGRAILQAARQHGRVVQIGTQRRSTPHLVEARDRFIREGKLGKVGLVEIYCYYHMRNSSDPPDQPPPDDLDWEMWTGPAPMRPYNPIAHPRGWRAFMEYGNGIVGDMCVHMLDMVRWMLELGWPKEVSSTGGTYIAGKTKSNISDTQTATFSFPGLDVIWNHRTWGALPVGMAFDAKGWDGPVKHPRYPWGATIYGDKGTLEASVMGYTFTPSGGGPPVHADVTYELEQYPEDKTEKDIERHVAPAVRYHMKDLLACVASRGRPVADIEEGYVSTASCILANLSMKLGRSLRFDPEGFQITGDDQATGLLRRPYRAPWTHPGASTA